MDKHMYIDCVVLFIERTCVSIAYYMYVSIDKQTNDSPLKPEGKMS